MEEKTYILPDWYNFKTIDEFKECMLRGGEVGFIWKGKQYFVCGNRDGDENSPVRTYIGEAYYMKDGKRYNIESHEEVVLEESDRDYDTPDEALEYIVGGDRLRDVITQVEVLYRTI